jgi:predicted RNA-binding protein YlxR (DUF448 family)
MRRCIACRESKPQDELIRFTYADGIIRADGDKPADGRGFYLCRDSKCIETAIKKKSFNRICRRNVDEGEIKSVIEQALNNN